MRNRDIGSSGRRRCLRGAAAYTHQRHRQRAGLILHVPSMINYFLSIWKPSTFEEGGSRLQTAEVEAACSGLNCVPKIHMLKPKSPVWWALEMDLWEV